uniref:Uncharacterized protein n=1 Tax=Vitrella brassicaformis TaxID=1169539 RepID=A0A7S1NXU3_9ALVE|mmetsp:Transcript_10367/g.25080  ORF Transcript_10367/g.25080 Transcript_10367/m.25080 type:complete len:121 (+) Transcript_10367:343-705(+)
MSERIQNVRWLTDSSVPARWVGVAVVVGLVGCTAMLEGRTLGQGKSCIPPLQLPRHPADATTTQSDRQICPHTERDENCVHTHTHTHHGGHSVPSLVPGGVGEGGRGPTVFLRGSYRSAA